jgi:hypothetical protein
MTFMNSTGCPTGDATCARVLAMEPGLPIRPQFSKDFVNPCVEMAGKTVCLPYVHIISGWHMFSSESLGWLKNVKQLEMRGGGGCFDDWDGDQGGNKWAQSWGGPPASGAVITAHCDKLLSWYPAFAGRYTSAWVRERGQSTWLGCAMRHMTVAWLCHVPRGRASRMGRARRRRLRRTRRPTTTPPPCGRSVIILCAS